MASGSASMKGAMWKRGHTIPTMSRVYCVLEGSMLSVYNSEHEFDRGLPPHRVIEVTQVQPWDGRTTFKHYEHCFALHALSGKSYQCSVDSAQLQKEWTDAFQASLEEPYRIVADEIIEAQKELNSDVKAEHDLADAAADAVRRAEVASKAIAGGESNVQLLKDKLTELNAKLAAATKEHADAEDKAQEALLQSRRAKDAAHEDMIKYAKEPTKVSDELKRDAAMRAAMYEVEANVASTAQKSVHDILSEIHEMELKIATAANDVATMKKNAEQTIQNATGAIHSAQTAKAKVKLRLASWTSTPSHVDSLAQGYLKVKNNLQPKMHRKYFVLYGKTLCWYKTADDSIHNIKSPLGVLHVAGPIKDWSGKVGLTTYPNAFAIPTVEGKELHVSASVSNEVSTWSVAILTGATMIPMSPERARDAKVRRDSFDLTSPARHHNRMSFFASDSTSPLDTSPHPLSPALLLETAQLPVVEGSLVKQGHFVPTMRRKYCVLVGVHIFFFESHEHYMQSRGSHPLSPETATVSFSEVARVVDWDGSLLLMTYPHAFQIDTVHHAHIHCSAASAGEKERWMKGLRAAIAHHKAKLKSVGAVRDGSSHLALESQVPLTDQARAVLEFETILTAYLQQHNPAKHEDVFVMTKLFQGREGELLTHLDETYNTTLATDHASLVTKLAKFHRLKLHDESAIETDGLIPHLEGLLTYHVPAFIGANMTKIYAVLLGNKLLHFATRIAALTEPDHPDVTFAFTVADTVPGHECKLHVVDVDEKKHTYETTSVAQRDQWLRTMHLGLDYARVHHQRRVLHVTESTVLQEMAEPTYDESPESAEFKQLVVAYYEQHNPDGLSSVEALLLHFRGKEHLLLGSLDKIYGTKLTEDETMVRLCTVMSETEAVTSTVAARRGSGSFWRTTVATDGSIPQHKKEGFVMIKCAPTLPKLKKCFCVIEDTLFTCFSGLAREAVLLGPWHIQNVQVGDGQFSLYVETAEDTKLFGQLPTEVEFHAWLSAFHVAIAAHQVTKLNDTPLAKHLVAFYARANPSKMDQVPLLLDSFAGHEIDLLYKIDAVYHSTLATDPAVLALLPTAIEVPAAAQESHPDQAILMEGYFMKKGFQMPSMTKYYGVLKRHILHVYDTKEDAVTGTTVHHPKDIAAVVEWAGSTHEKFRFGIEFATADHRMYFCGFPSEEDKVHWMSAIQHGLALKRLAARVAAGTLQSDTTKALRDKIVHGYSHVSQHFVEEINAVLELSHGFDVDVLKMLDKKYGTHMAMDPSITEMLDAVVALATPGVFEAPLQLTSPDGATAQPLFGVLDQTTLTCYATREGYKSELLKPQVAITCLAVTPWKESLGFVIDTAEGSPVYMQCETADAAAKWLDELQTALDKATLRDLLHSIPTDDASVISSFLSIQANNSMVRRFVVFEELEVKLYATPDALEPVATLVVDAFGPWAAPTNTGFAFQLECHRITADGKLGDAQALRCMADTKDTRDKWETHVTEALRLKAGIDLMADQAFEVDHAGGGKLFHDATLRGYMAFRKQTKRKFSEPRDGYFILDKNQLVGFADETKARAGNDATQIVRMTVLSLFELQDAATTGMRPKDFYVHAKLAAADEELTFHFLPPDENDRNVWVAAINDALNESRGRALLLDQQLDVQAHATATKEANPREGFVIVTSTMEGELQRFQESFLHAAREPSQYFVLAHDTLAWFPTKGDAAQQATKKEEGALQLHDNIMQIISVADWIMPMDALQSGFQVDGKLHGGAEATVMFDAGSLEMKERWIRALKAASDESVAEQTLRDFLRRQATFKAQVSVCDNFREGFIHLRRSHFAASWKEYYGVLKGPWLSTYATREEYVTRMKPSAKVEVVFVGDWYGAVSAGVKNIFRIETIEEGFMEVYVDDADEKGQWMSTLADAVATLKANELVTRNLALPCYPGATMEGYLTKNGGKFRGGQTRYCVLLRTLWLYYATQEDALASVDPLGTLQVTGVDVTATDATVPEHAFQLQTTSATEHLCCEAHSGAEKTLWVNAIKAELDQEEKLRGDIRAAEARERSKAEQLADTVNKTRAINEEAAARDAEMAARLKQLERFNSGDFEDDSDSDETPYVEMDGDHVDLAPENSPVRRASKNKQPAAAPADTDEESGSAPFWLSWCRCFSRPPLDPNRLRQDPTLTEHEKRFYRVEYYSNGTVDSSL
ncbi:Aste57867_15212 [Aphanomyces stellatus]|uniref:Aste57867_15212 protein n=1 Tax=Aphanomyces stellatus TaxID=120398 RepID=A0A485L4F6_9STRA|nr:hypothetical protein As57867_015156 [Aphanomyces stellatus]VFT92021.1 Aste57867_15212 [Aphanomyces stellatus]